MNIFLQSLGCARNLVDSEIMIGRLRRAGFHITDDPQAAEIIVVNTCGFIAAAIDESIDTILELAENKKSARCQKLIVAGCLTERFGSKLAEDLPEVDYFLGTGAYDRIVAAVSGSVSLTRCVLPDPDSLPVQRHDDPRILSTPHTAYLKVTEGCGRRCTYCIIPKLRGRPKSRNPEDIVSEAKKWIAAGVKELVLVAQDTTAYGVDLNEGTNLARLLEKMADLRETGRASGDAAIAEDYWVRFLYGHPQSLHDSVIRTVAAFPNLCSYFDIPIQHADEGVLKRMGRHYGPEALKYLFDRIRNAIPEATLRTTVMVGFPGEKDRDFQNLLDFIETVRFDHLGVFIYSDSEDLPSHRLPDHVPADLAQERWDYLMRKQKDISRSNIKKYRGRRMTVLLEEQLDSGAYTGRTSFQAPEVDGMTYIQTKATWPYDLKPGCFIQVRMTDTIEYDLIGEPE